jgi:iron complex transport system ATP-binding protein
VIAFRNVALRIGGRPLLDGIDGRVESGELVALLGPNGVGKTTLLRAIAGMFVPASGSIVVDGASVTQMTPLERARRVAFVTSDDVLLDALRVRDVVAMGRYPHHRWWQWQEQPADEAAIDRALTSVELETLSSRLFSTLSSGERQRVWIALGLAQETPVLLLDEPTSHLDVRVAHEILALLRRLAREGKSVVCALHDLNDAAVFADRIALLGEGRLLAFDVPDRVFTGTLVERAYGIAMETVQTPSGTRIFARGG